MAASALCPQFDPGRGNAGDGRHPGRGLARRKRTARADVGADRDGPARRSRSPQRDYAAVVDTWTAAAGALAAGLAQAGPGGAVMIPVDSSTVGAPVRLSLDQSTRSQGAVAEVWLHNGTASAVGPLALRCGQLTTADGTVLDGVQVGFEPREVELFRPGRAGRARIGYGDRFAEPGLLPRHDPSRWSTEAVVAVRGGDRPC